MRSGLVDPVAGCFPQTVAFNLCITFQRRLCSLFHKLALFPPKSIFTGLPELQHLDVYGNKLTDISPPEASSLTKLEYLDAGYNRLTAIPVELADLPSLKYLKFMDNAIEIIPAVICENMALRMLDVSSNPLIQPPLETCKRGLYSMRRYYHCLKLEEMSEAPGAAGAPNSRMFKKIKYEKSRVKMRKKKDLAKKMFPTSLGCSCIFRTTSEPCRAADSMLSAVQAPSRVPLELGWETISALTPCHETPPTRSVSCSESKGAGPIKNRRGSCPLHPSADAVARPPLPESDRSEGSVDSDVELLFAECAENLQLVGLNNAAKTAGEITVNDTLKVIFVGMAHSGKTSIIRRLIDGKEAKLPHKDERTIGVDIYEWDPKSSGGSAGDTLQTQIPIDEELESRIRGNVDVKFSVWDFAGQHVYHVSLFVNRPLTAGIGVNGRGFADLQKEIEFNDMTRTGEEQGKVPPLENLRFLVMIKCYCQRHSQCRQGRPRECWHKLLQLVFLCGQD